MTPLALLLGLPLLSALVLAFVARPGAGARINLAASLGGLIAAIAVAMMPPEPGGAFRVDALTSLVLVLNALVAFTTAIFNLDYVAHEAEMGRLTPPRLRIYHALYQVLIFAMNLALVADSIGIMWVAIELATLTSVVVVGLYRTPEALEAAWKYFILGSVGIALALFGTILVYVAAQPVLGEGSAGMLWSALEPAAARLDPALLSLGFVFLLLGYGTKVGLVPLHAWLPDAHAEGPTPVSAILSGLLLNVALHALLRFKVLLEGQPAALPPGPVMVAMGLATMVLAAFMMYGRRDLKRLFAFSSIEHMGLMVLAFGLGGPLAAMGGLLHMIQHSLTKSAIFFAVGRIQQVKGTQRISAIQGLTETHPVLGWGLVAGVVAIVGLPPFGLFLSEFRIVTAAGAEHPLLAAALLLALLLAFGALVLRLHGLAFGVPDSRPSRPLSPGWPPLLIHLVLVLVTGLWLPPFLAGWLSRAAALLG